MAVGRVDVDRMLDELTPEQVDEWYAFYRLEPWGDPWEHTASILAQLNNVNCASQQDVRQPSDYRPFQKPKRPNVNLAEVLSRWRRSEH